MKLDTIKNGNELTVIIEGRLDTTTAPELDKLLIESTEGIEKLILDISGLEYVSSAGLRVFLSAHKRMAVAGEMIVRGANEVVAEIFDITGFSDILTIEN